MLDACQIAGLNTMRLMHETTATALAYGIFKTAEFGDDPHNVVFVDVGHSSLQVCVVRFTKSGLKVLATGFDRNLGGNAFDQAMFDHFCDEFKETQKIDIKSNARASLRLRVAVEKMKKILMILKMRPRKLLKKQKILLLKLTGLQRKLNGLL